jgi:hypothetical protein
MEQIGEDKSDTQRQKSQNVALCFDEGENFGNIPCCNMFVISL